MRFFFPLTFAGPAVAHDGLHFHPHDSGTWFFLVIGLATIGVAVWVIRRGSR